MAQDLVFDAHTEAEKSLASWLYVAHGLSVLFTLGALSFIPLIFNYVKRSGTSGTFVHSHHSWQIRSFWWYVVWIIIAGALAATFILLPLAWLVGGAAWLWKAYRLIRGWVTLHNNQPI